MSLSFKDKIALKILGDWPNVNYYRVLEGMIQGPVRYESLDGSEIYLNPTSPDGLTYFKNATPYVDVNRKVYGISNIQKKSPYGWLRTDPHAYFWWKMSKLQDVDATGNFIPGTEKGIYYRAPLVWRIDMPGTLIDGVVRHWIPSWGHIGPRYD